MNFKFGFLAFLLSIILIASCTKEDVDVTVVDEEETTTVTEVVNCDSLFAQIVPEVDNSLSVVVEFGTAPYAYQWTTGETEQTISTTGEGTYEATVTDAAGCNYTASYTYPDACASIYATISISGTELTANVSGGTAPYTYEWSNGATSGGTTVTSSGWYELTVTDSEGCTVTTGINVQLPSDCSSLSAFVIDTLSNLFVITSGGNPPYSYEWSTGEMSEFLDITGVTSGTYEVTITDSEGCSLTESYTVQEGGNDCSDFIITSIGMEGNELCVNVDGGVPPYNYLWSTDETGNCISVESGNTYSVLIADSQGCSLTDSYLVP